MKEKNKGQSVVEILISLAVFSIILLGVLFLFFKSLDNSRRAVEVSQAQNLAQEGIEGVRAIANNNWKDLADGSYEIENSIGYWQFTTPRSQLLLDKYYRKIEILPVSRNSVTCLLEAGDYDDPNIKEIVSTVEWESGEKTQTISYNTYLTGWVTSVAKCPKELGPGGQAGALSLNTAGASIDELLPIYMWVFIGGVKIKNISASSVTVDKVQVFMNDPIMKVWRFEINDSRRYGPTGGILSWLFTYQLYCKPSGTILNIDDYIIVPGEEVTISMKFSIDHAYSPVIYSINFIMKDGTEIKTNNFTL